MGTDQLSLQCACTPVVDTQYDPTNSGSPAQTIVRAIAAISDTDPASLPPIAESIDPDALNRLFAANAGDSDSPVKILSFTVDGWNVFVRDDGHIRVCDPTRPAAMSPIFD